MDDKRAWDAWIAELQAKVDQVEAALKPAADKMKSIAEYVGKEAADRQNALKPLIDKMEALVAEVRKMTQPPG